MRNTGGREKTYSPSALPRAYLRELSIDELPGVTAPETTAVMLALCDALEMKSICARDSARTCAYWTRRAARFLVSDQQMIFISNEHRTSASMTRSSPAGDAGKLIDRKLRSKPPAAVGKVFRGPRGILIALLHLLSDARRTRAAGKLRLVRVRPALATRAFAVFTSDASTFAAGSGRGILRHLGLRQLRGRFEGEVARQARYVRGRRALGLQPTCAEC